MTDGLLPQNMRATKLNSNAKKKNAKKEKMRNDMKMAARMKLNV